MMYDPFLTPIVATWPTRTCEEVREALQSIPSYRCDYCGAQYGSPSAMFACEEDCLDMRPRD